MTGTVWSCDRVIPLPGSSLGQVEHLPGVQVPHEGLEDLGSLLDGGSTQQVELGGVGGANSATCWTDWSVCFVKEKNYLNSSKLEASVCGHLVPATLGVDKHQQRLHQLRGEGLHQEGLPAAILDLRDRGQP